MDEQVLQVSEFIGLINQTLEFAYPRVLVEGEVTGFNISHEKWVHFSLKDENGLVGCFTTVWQLKTPLEDGMKVVVAGRPKIHEKSGRFSLNVDKVTLSGEGALKRAYELLKRKLETEGLFAPERKRPLPPYPQTIGLIASHDSAAFKDFIKILNQRWGGVSVKAAHVQVQGEPAATQVAGAIDYFNQLAAPVDVLVITRGGGSLEDLQAFNTETVTRAVASSRTPTIVGVGHEIDVSLADLAADVRAATPTDAARLVVPDKQEVFRSLEHQQASLVVRLERVLAAYRHRLRHSLQVINHAVSPGNLRERVEALEHTLVARQRVVVNQSKQRLLGLVRTLRNLDPRALLERGYAIARLKGEIVRSADQVTTGDMLLLQLAKGKLDTEVKAINKD